MKQGLLHNRVDFPAEEVSFTEQEMRGILAANTFSDLQWVLGNPKWDNLCRRSFYDYSPLTLKRSQFVHLLESMDVAAIVVDLVWFVTSYPQVMLFTPSVAWMVLLAAFALVSLIGCAWYFAQSRAHQRQQEQFGQALYLRELQQRSHEQLNHLSPTPSIVMGVSEAVGRQVLNQRWKTGREKWRHMAASLGEGALLTNCFAFTYLWAAPDLLNLVGFPALSVAIASPTGLAIVGVLTVALLCYAAYKVYQKKKGEWMQKEALEEVDMKKMLFFSNQGYRVELSSSTSPRGGMEHTLRF